MTKIDNDFYFLWFQEIANRNVKFNILIYKKLIKIFQDSRKIYIISSNISKLNELVKNANIDYSIIEFLYDNNIKEETKILYDYIKKNNLKIVSYESEGYPLKLKTNKYSPFYILITKKIDMNSKNIYIYFNEYFTKFAKRIIEYFSKIITKENCNTFSNYKNNEIFNIEILSNYKPENGNKNNLIILPSKRYLNTFFNSILNALIIVEARYEEDIVKLVDSFLENGKDIYVVPSNIFRKNSYFSNYLIKQGADIILNKEDIKFVLRTI